MGIDAKRAPARAGLAVALLLLCGGCSLIGSVVGTAAKVATSAAGAKLSFACIPEGTLVDTPDGPVPIETLRAGDPVIGFDGEVVRVLQKHSYAEDPEVAFLTVEFANGSKVDLCGMHRIAGARAKTLIPGDDLAGHRVVRITRYTGVERSYDLLTEDSGYRIQGIPVNSMIEEMYAAGRSGEIPTE
jgi:hypothetical protein